MPIRNIPLVTGEYYHVFNRGVAKQPIFSLPRHYIRFERTCNYYQTIHPTLRFSKFLQLNQTSQIERISTGPPQQQIELIAYILMPNHFHFLLKQTAENGISNFMRNLGNSYTRYFNIVSFRVGPVFQGQFKAVHIESNYHLLHLSRYIHLNCVIGRLVSENQIESYIHSSYSQYINNHPSGTLVVNPSIVLDQFKSRQEYQQFCLDYTDYGFTLAAIKHSLIDPED